MFSLKYLTSFLTSKEERLRIAVQQRNPQNVREILEHKPALDTPECGRLLRSVAEEWNPEIAVMLVKAGANLKELQKDIIHKLVCTLHHSVQKSIFTLLLLDRGVDVNVLDDRNTRPIFYAVQRQSMIMVKALLKRGSLVDEETIREAAEKSEAAELLRLLVSRKWCDEDTHNRRGLLALARLVELEKNEEEILPVVRVVLGFKLDLNKFDMNCKHGTVLVHAITHKKKEVVELLLNHGADVNKKSPNGMYPLYAAVALRQPSIAQILLREGANVNRSIGIECFNNSPTMRQSSCPIHVACTDYCLQCLKLLLLYGADINAVNEQSATPFSLLKPRMSTVHQTMMKHMAILVTRNVAVSESDLEIIEGDSDMCEFYENCLSELETMKNQMVTEGLSLFSVMSKNLKEVSFYARNDHFVRQCNVLISKKTFPTYFSSMKFMLKEAVERKNLLNVYEKAINAGLGNFLPTVPLERIIFYFYL